MALRGVARRWPWQKRRFGDHQRSFQLTFGHQLLGDRTVPASYDRRVPKPGLSEPRDFLLAGHHPSGVEYAAQDRVEFGDKQMPMLPVSARLPGFGMLDNDAVLHRKAEFPCKVASAGLSL
jgi:hypothetical protein